MKLNSGKILLSVLCLSIVSCSSVMPGDGSSLYLDKKASENSVYFVQVPASSEQQQSNDIMQQAARQISIRKKAFIRYTVTENRTSYQIDYDQNNLIQLSENLEILKMTKADLGIQALVRQKGSTGFKNQKISVTNSSGKDGNPEWVARTYKNAAYYAAVGSVSPRSAASDGFMNADTCAIVSLAVYVAKPFVSGSSTMYEAEIVGAYIARRWYNKEKNTYYSLAVIPRTNGLIKPAK